MITFLSSQNPDLFDAPEWPHAVHMMAHIYANSLCVPKHTPTLPFPFLTPARSPPRREDARFVYKRTPEAIRASNADITAAFALLQRLWVRDYEGIWTALGYAWPPQLAGLAAALGDQLRQRLLALVQRAYVSISAANLGRLLGMSEGDANAAASAAGWAEEGGFLAPPPAPAHAPLEPNESDLQKIAQYVVFLQTGEAPPEGSAA